MPRPEGVDLLEHCKARARESHESLEGPEDDILPLLMWLGPYGVGIMPLTEMQDEDAKDRLADMMITALAVSRASEACMVTTSWMVKAQRDEFKKATEDPDYEPTAMEVLGCQPSEHPDRVECISLMHVRHQQGDDEYQDSMSSAVITRHPGKKPDLGEWETDLADMRVGGRFGDAMHIAFDMVAEMPPQLVEIIDESFHDGKGEELYQRFHNVLMEFRRAMENMTPEQRREMAERAKENRDE